MKVILRSVLTDIDAVINQSLADNTRIERIELTPAEFTEAVVAIRDRTSDDSLKSRLARAYLTGSNYFHWRGVRCVRVVDPTVHG